MVAQPAAQDLRAERVRLEGEIAQLRARLVTAERRAVRAEARGPDPRGFGVGLFVGALVVAGTVGGLFLWMASVIGHMD